ncbi:MAG: TIGR02186 family protein, partial [Pseudolabrys sp.]
MRRFAVLLPLVAALLVPAGVARAADAERLVVSLSNHRVQVTSNFTGEELVLFGTIETAKGATPRGTGYDLVVT